VQVLLFGGIVERRFGRRQFLGLVAGSGIATTAAQVASYVVVGAGRPIGTLGASGIVLAMTALAVVDSLRYRRVTGAWHGEATWIWVLLGGFVVAQAVIGLSNLASGTASVGVVGHLTGVIIGFALGLVRPAEAVLSGGDTRRQKHR
jgi:membrane associated rhomboid family serine protease